MIFAVFVSIEPPLLVYMSIFILTFAMGVNGKMSK
jgi:hypothetical protein